LTPAVRIWKPADTGGKSVSWNIFAILCIGLVLAEGCSVGPKYVKPVAQIPASYKEMGNWKTAEPSDAARKDKWWEVFRDPELNALEDKLTVSNQTLRAAQDRFLEARAALKFSRAGEFPQVTAGGLASRQRSSSNRPLRGPTSAGLLHASRVGCTEGFV
jgi:outer membrane protein TolC